MHFTDREQLGQWFEEEGWFDDGRLFACSPTPGPQAPDEATLEIGRWVSGGLDPGDVRVFRVFRLMAHGVSRYSIGPPGHSPEHWSQGVELVEEGLGFTMDAPGLVRIEFRDLDVERLDDRSERVAPSISDRRIWVVTEGGELPSPGDWVEGLARTGVTAKWNFCGDDEVSAHEPSGDYQGWCLQAREQRELQEVVFLGCRRTEPAGYSLTIERRGPAGKLWRAIQYLASAQPGSVVRSGNVELNRGEWRRYLEDGVLPDQPRGWSKSVSRG